MLARSRWLHLSVGLFSMSLLLTACGTLPVDTVRECVENCKPHCKVFNKPTMMNLARDLDHLERHIESHGSIVIQKPAVWGQARLTQYRQEFEAVMQPEKDTFRETLQGSISRSDQAFLVNAMAISAAASGDAAVSRTPPGTFNKEGTTEMKQQVIIPLATAELPKFAGDTANSQITTPTFKDGLIVNSSNFSSALKRAATDATQETLKISLEPTLVLEQKARYLNYLQQIRRTNEGDDTTDSPGYALHLMRIPVSVLPGKCTQAGHGAEVTLSLAPSLGDELLPVTFRNLVINDLVDQISMPLVGFLNSPDALTIFRDVKPEDAFKREEISYDQKSESAPQLVAFEVNGQGVAFPADQARAASGKNPKAKANAQKMMSNNLTRSRPAIKGGQGSRLAAPPSQIYDNFGTTFSYWVAFDAYNSFQNEIASKNLIHLPDLQVYLKEELNAAYKFLTTDQNQPLWEQCSRELAEAIRNRQSDRVKTLRDTYRKFVYDRVIIDSNKKNDEGSRRRQIELSTTSALGWAIIVNSALLNEQLNQDRREIASAKGLTVQKDWLPFYLPNPPADARSAFHDYVRQRWPIHVFALDPMTQDQNFADVFSTRREMQLALSMAFASGNINAQQLTRYARRIEAQYDTIAINRTAVGFSHGDDTFGWRFYPRFQTPDIESNAKVLVRDMFIGGPNRDQLLNQRKLEPGIRECVAIVLMPAFVPYVNCDVTTHWFKLNNPKHRSADCTDALKLSRQVKSMQISAGNVRDADCYRDGEIMRLIRKVDQLSARLPLQSHQFQVPYENTIGGFQMFNTGVTDLAPELDGWYGAPGISTKSATTLFLVGRNLSVRNTQVVAGGRRVTTVDLLSRQVMRVEIPSNVEVKKLGQERLFVEIHVATPYGVTQHLQIPISDDVAPSRTGFSVTGARADQQVVVTYDVDKSIKEVKLLPAELKYGITNQSTAPFAADLKKANLKWRLDAFNAAGTKLETGDFTAIEITFGADKTAPVEIADIEAKLLAQLRGKVTKDHGVRRLIASPYLEVTSGQNGMTSTIQITLDNLLVWTVTEAMAQPK